VSVDQLSIPISSTGEFL